MKRRKELRVTWSTGPPEESIGTPKRSEKGTGPKGRSDREPGGEIGFFLLTIPYQNYGLW